MIRHKIYESELRQALIRFGEIYQFLEIPGPYYVSLTLLGVKGLTICPDMQFDWSGLRPISTDDVVVPLRVIERWTGDPDAALKPLFDLIWNACGLPRSRNYDGNDQWIPER